VLRESQRPLTAEERRVLERVLNPGRNVAWGPAITFTAVAAVIGATVGSCLEGKAAWPVGVATTVILAAVSIRANLKARQVENEALRGDLARAQALLLEVEDPDVLVQHGNGVDVLVMKVDPEWIFVLADQELGDERTYGCDEELFHDPAHVNGLPDPYGFPARRFELALAPLTGLLFSIRVRGPYLAPRRELSADEAVTVEAAFTRMRADDPRVKNLFAR